MLAGVNTMNQVLSFSRSLLLGQAKLQPEDAEAAGKAAQDMQLLSTPLVTTDTNTIQHFYYADLRDILFMPFYRIKSVSVSIFLSCFCRPDQCTDG